MTLVNSINPFRLEGQKTAAFEICDDLGRAPDVLAIPVGNAGNISAYWAGFRDYAAAGIIATTPADAGASRRPAPRRSSSATGSSTPRPSRPRSASAIPRRGAWPIDARDGSGGRISAVTDDEILAAYRGARPLRGHLLRARLGGQRRRASRKAAAAGELDPDATVVCVLTGHGLKDPTTAERQVPPFLEAEPTVGSVAVALGW